MTKQRRAGARNVLAHERRQVHGSACRGRRVSAVGTLRFTL